MSESRRRRCLTLVATLLAVGCAREPHAGYVETLNGVGLLAGDASSALFPLKAPMGNREFALEDLVTAALALRDLAELAEQPPPSRFRDCHASVRAHANGLGDIASVLLAQAGEHGSQTHRVAMMLDVWIAVRSRTQRRLCGLSDAIAACAREANDSELDRILAIAPSRLRCLDNKPNNQRSHQ